MFGAPEGGDDPALSLNPAHAFDSRRAAAGHRCLAIAILRQAMTKDVAIDARAGVPTNDHPNGIVTRHSSGAVTPAALRRGGRGGIEAIGRSCAQFVLGVRPRNRRCPLARAGWLR